jgi:hypothetical protein
MTCCLFVFDHIVIRGGFHRIADRSTIYIVGPLRPFQLRYLDVEQRASD